MFIKINKETYFSQECQFSNTSNEASAFWEVSDPLFTDAFVTV